MFNKIKYKLALTVLVVAVVAAIPLSMYILMKQEKEKIESTIAIGRGNTKLLGKTMLDVFLKSGGEPGSMRIDAEEAMNTYKDQFDLGLVYGQTLMLSKTHRGLIMATLDKNRKSETGKDKLQPGASVRKEEEIINLMKYEENHSGPCFNNPTERCYNFAFVAKYEKTPVILSVMSISEKQVLEPIQKLRLLIYISAGVAVVLALLLGVGVSRFITGPITAAKTSSIPWGRPSTTWRTRLLRRYVRSKTIGIISRSKCRNARQSCVMP